MWLMFLYLITSAMKGKEQKVNDLMNETALKSRFSLSAINISRIVRIDQV